MYRFRMKNKFSWAILGLLAAVVAEQVAEAAKAAPAAEELLFRLRPQF